VRLLKEDTNELVVLAREALKPVEPWDEGWPSHMTDHVTSLVRGICGICEERYVLNVPRVPYVLSYYY